MVAATKATPTEERSSRLDLSASRPLRQSGLTAVRSRLPVWP